MVIVMDSAKHNKPRSANNSTSGCRKRRVQYPVAEEVIDMAPPREIPGAPGEYPTTEEGLAPLGRPGPR